MYYSYNLTALANGTTLSVVVKNNRTNTFSNTVQRSACCFAMITIPGDQSAYVLFRLFESHLA